MSGLSRLAWHIAISLVFAIAAGYLFLFVDQQVCGEVHGKNAAGGGAAIGMLAVVSSAIGLAASLVLLSAVDLGRVFKIWSLKLSGKTELIFLSGALAVWGVVALALMLAIGC